MKLLKLSHVFVPHFLLSEDTGSGGEYLSAIIPILSFRESPLMSPESEDSASPLFRHLPLQTSPIMGC
jgi:hypothetical protein